MADSFLGRGVKMRARTRNRSVYAGRPKPHNAVGVGCCVKEQYAIQ
jgi:hypothetical protein